MICPFCNNSVTEFHRRSHVIPEWMYSGCYDEGHKIIEVSRLDERAIRRQKGIYNSFICKKCEKEVQKYDHYASLVLTERSPSAVVSSSVKKEYFRELHNGNYLEFVRWLGLDFKKFQNFVFSVILRAYFAQNDENPFSLIKKQLTGIMTIYKGIELDDTSYPITIMEYPKVDEFRNHVILPYVTRKEGHHVIEFAGSGYVFNIYISGHSRPSYVTSLSLKKDGSLYTIIESSSKTGLFNGMVQIIKSVKAGPKNIQ